MGSQTCCPRPLGKCGSRIPIREGNGDMPRLVRTRVWGSQGKTDAAAGPQAEGPPQSLCGPATLHLGGCSKAFVELRVNN